MEEKDLIEQQPGDPGQQQIPPEDQNLLEEVQKLKENTVSKAEYERLLKRNKELTQAWMNNKEIQEAQKDTDTIDSLRSELYSDNRKEMTNLESVTKMLKLREKVIESGGSDPFASSDTSTITDEEIRTAERVAAGLQNMVDEADGNAAYFNALLKSQVDSTMPMRNKSFRR